MKSFLSLFLTICIVSVTFYSCYYDKEELLYPNVTPCDTTNVTFAIKIAPILNANCLSCHGNSVYLNAGGGIKLQDYGDVKANLDQAYNDIITARMPKGGAKLDACSITALRIWKNAGAPNN